MAQPKTQLLSVWEAIREEYEFLSGEKLGSDFGDRVRTYNRECQEVQRAEVAAVLRNYCAEF
jgi:hypothetical protein